MTEETKELTPVNQEEVKEEIKEEAPALSEVETAALAKGWTPKDQWEGEPSEWRSAEIYLALDPFFKKIESQSKRLKDAEKTIQLFNEHHKRVNESAYKDAVLALRREKKQALEDGDADKVIDVDSRIDDLREKVTEARQAEQVAKAQAPEVHPEFQNWISDNKWYSSNVEMRDFADTYGQSYARSHPGVDPQIILQEVQKSVKRAFPDKFKNPAREAASAVEGSSPARKSREADYQLTEEETKVMNRFVRQGILTKEQYIADLKKIKTREQ